MFQAGLIASLCPTVSIMCNGSLSAFMASPTCVAKYKKKLCGGNKKKICTDCEVIATRTSGKRNIKIWRPPCTLSTNIDTVKK